MPALSSIAAWLHAKAKPAPAALAAVAAHAPLPAADPCTPADLARRIQENLPGIPHALITGAVLAGKSTLAAQLRASWTGCVVHLHQAATPPAGFDSAPLMGEWQDRGSTQVQSAELGDILATRPDGVFTLEMPSQADTGVVLSALLWPVLLGNQALWRTKLKHASAPPTVTLMLEDPAEWLVEHLLEQLLSRGRVLGLRVVVISPDDDAHSPAVWSGLGHVLALRCGQRQAGPRLAAWFDLPAEALARLPKGVALYRPASAASGQRPEPLPVRMAPPG